MSRNEPCFCGSEKKHKKCHPDITSESRAADVLRLYHKLDEELNSFTATATELPPCQKGCDSCCYQNFTISDIEFKLIARELKSWDTDRLQHLFETTHSLLEELKVKHSDVYQNLEAEGTNNFNVLNKQVALMHDTLDIPCPLLDTATGSCSVYDARPFICRSHGVSHISNEEFSVCEHIPSNQANIPRSLDATNFSDDAIDFWALEVGGERVAIRTYPIVYWLMLLFRYSQWEDTKIVSIPREGRDFRTSAHNSKREQIRAAKGQ